MRSRIYPTMIGLAAFLLAISPSYSQIMYGQSASGSLHLVYSHWSAKDSSGTTKITQSTVPFRGFIPLRDNLEAVVYVAGSSNDLDSPKSDRSLSGLSDIRLQLNSSFKEDQLLLSLGINLPTGKKKLSHDAGPAVLQMLSQNYFSFPMRRFGEGFGFSVLLGGAQMIGPLRCGAGIMYQFNGKYDPYEDVSGYDPGDIISVNAGGDWQGKMTTVYGGIVFSRHSADKQSDTTVFKQSYQMNLHAGILHGEEGFRLGGNVGYVVRGRNTTYLNGEDRAKIYGNEFRIGANLNWKLQPNWYLVPAADLRLIAANEKDFGSSTILGFGAGIRREMDEQLSLGLGLKFFTGTANGGDIDLSGFQITASARANL